MKLLARFIAMLIAGTLAHGAGGIDDFLGLNFGANRDAAVTAMNARGFKLKGDKSGVDLTFEGGTVAGEPAKHLKLEFAGDAFYRSIVTISVRNGKREEAALQGVECYDRLKTALTEKYGSPAKQPGVSRNSILSGKARKESLVTVWQGKSALSAASSRTITLSMVSMSMYEWVMEITYADDATKSGGARKDL